MCHPGFPSFDGFSSERAEQTRWFMLQVASMVQAMNLPRAIDRPGDGGGVAGSIQKQCLCSPTQHPGSFRCRQHFAEYQWGRRLYMTRPVTQPKHTTPAAATTTVVGQ